MLGMSVRAYGQAGDTLATRISQLIGTGDRHAAQLLADSVLRATSPESPVFAEALYWRGFTAPSAAEAERDYLRLAIEYPLAPRSADALLLLSQLEFARGDRAGALRHLERLVRDHPAGATVGRASFWTARIAFETGDTVRACAALSRAKLQLPADDVETRNQVDYFQPRCAVRPAATTDSTVAGGLSPRGPDFSLQVAAFKTRREAQVLERRLKVRGFDVRIAHYDAWYRVRIGRYSKRADADAAQQRLKKSRVISRVVEAEPR